MVACHPGVDGEEDRHETERVAMAAWVWTAASVWSEAGDPVGDGTEFKTVGHGNPALTFHPESCSTQTQKGVSGARDTTGERSS